jgi:hypothetical protein
MAQNADKPKKPAAETRATWVRSEYRMAIIPQEVMEMKISQARALPEITRRDAVKYSCIS